MKPITIDNFITNLCLECGNGCLDLCICAETLKNMGDKYKIYTLASTLEIAGDHFRIAEQKASERDYEGSIFYYKAAYNNLKSSVNKKEIEEIEIE